MFPLPPRLAALIPMLLLLAAGEAKGIINGVEAADGEFPWIAGIVQRGNFPFPALIGGGALLGDQWVVTAAHTVSDLAPGSLDVWLESNNLADTSTRQVRQVLAIFIHPDFINTESGTSDSDLALLLLDQPIAHLPLLPILHDAFDLLLDAPATVAGWGTSTAGVSEPTLKLQKAPAVILAPASAEAVFGDLFKTVHLAAVDPAGLATPCVGDSGSPLVKKIEGTDTLVGLVSFGTADCADARQPTGYTRVSVFASWINEHLGLTANPPSLCVNGKNRIISNGSTSKAANATAFGDLRRPGQKRTRTFDLKNNGTGLLTVRATDVTRKVFTVRQAPASVIAAGNTTSIRVTFKAPRNRKTHRSQVRIFSNDPSQPLFVFQVSATVQ